MKKKILISGTSSGLGRYLLKRFNGYKFYRKSMNQQISNTKWDLIIHCAFDSKTFDIVNSEKYIQDNIANALYLSNLKGKKIFMSTAQVYEKNKLTKRSEIDYINPKKLSIYPLSKYICEQFFDDQDIVLRLGSIIGNNMRKNTVFKLLNIKKPKISLDKTSKFSFVTYDEIFEIINLLLNKKKSGIFNLLRDDYTTLEQIQKIFKVGNVKFGRYHFDVTKASNFKICKIKNLKTNSSIEALNTIKRK